MGHDISKYDNVLKHYGDNDGNPRISRTMRSDGADPKRLAFKVKAGKICDRLKEDCCHHLLLDIYLHALPMDDGCAENQRGRCSDDVNKLLASQDCTATQFFRSSAAATKAPLLEYVNRSIDMIGQTYMEAAEEKAAEDTAAGLETTDADLAPDHDAVDSQLVDIKKDTEYEDFIDKLKQKTIKKIVADISELITDKRDEKDMTFAPKLESAFCKSVDYISTVMLKAGAEPDMSNDDVMELAVRESTLFALTEAFAVGDRDVKNFTSRLRLNKGLVLTESAVMEICGDRDFTESYNPYADYDIIIAENAKFLEASVNEVYSEGVGAKIKEGAKWLLNKILELCRKLKNMIKNALKPKLQKQVEEILANESIRAAALTAIGSPVQRKRSKTAPDKATVATSLSTATSISDASANIMGAKAADRVMITLGDGSQLSNWTKATVSFAGMVQITDVPRTIEWIDKYLRPAINGGFTGASLVALKERYGDNGSTIPVRNTFAFTIAEVVERNNELIDLYETILSSPAVTGLANKTGVDPYFQVMLNAIYTHINTLNNELQLVNSSTIKCSRNPFTDEDLALIKTQHDLGKIVEALITDKVNTASSQRVFIMIRYIIAETVKKHGWVSSGNSVKSGASRIAVIGDDTVFKYAWNRKGIIDNKRELTIAKKIKGTTLEQYFAMPTEESSKTACFLVVPKAKPVTTLGTSTEKLVTDVNETAKSLGINLATQNMEKAENFGTIDGQLVIIDYANFAIY